MSWYGTSPAPAAAYNVGQKRKLLELSDADYQQVAAISDATYRINRPKRKNHGCALVVPQSRAGFTTTTTPVVRHPRGLNNVLNEWVARPAKRLRLPIPSDALSVAEVVEESASVVHKDLMEGLIAATKGRGEQLNVTRYTVIRSGMSIVRACWGQTTQPQTDN